MGAKNIGDFVKRNFGYVVGAASAAGMVALLATSPHYQERPKRNEFRRPEVRLVDFTPIYGMYSESSRDLGTDSFSEWIDAYARTFRDMAPRDVVSLGTARWPHETKYLKTELATAAQNVAMSFYQFGFPELLVLLNYLARRKRNDSSRQQE